MLPVLLVVVLREKCLFLDGFGGLVKNGPMIMSALLCNDQISNSSMNSYNTLSKT